MSTVELEASGAIAIVRISNPPNGYMNETVVRDLDRAMRRIDQNPNLKVVVLTGGLPDVFVQHYDLHELETLCEKLVERRRGSGGNFSHVPERPIDLIFRRLENSDRIVIAAINGNAMGGGCELAITCDFRLMQSGPYLIGLPEIRIGMLPGAGGTQRLTRLVGVAKGLDLMLHGRRLSPEQALEAGLVHEVVDGNVLDRAMERAHDLAQLPAKALAYVKRLAYCATEMPLYAALDLERSLFLDLMSSPEGLAMISDLNARGGDFRSL